VKTISLFVTEKLVRVQRQRRITVMQCFSTAGPRPGTSPWHQLYRAV